jgi:acyl carrier protein
MQPTRLPGAFTRIHGVPSVDEPRGIPCRPKIGFSMFEETAQKVAEVIASTQKLEPGKVHIDSTFEELQIDSLDGLNIVFALENEFNLDIPDDQAKDLKTVREAAERIHAIIENRASGAASSSPESA